ncbi:unnamed protein product [Ranitomeya imitator]|uniref:Uncharacterized protein n=1 Tax=Ranitomeya imitator TaxID=111125 RepID=A0ABN9L172_9NEOB|nr:unnamed protein product [Ranitomeya imitator]
MENLHFSAGSYLQYFETKSFYRSRNHATVLGSRKEHDQYGCTEAPADQFCPRRCQCNGFITTAGVFPSVPGAAHCRPDRDLWDPQDLAELRVISMEQRVVLTSHRYVDTKTSESAVTSGRSCFRVTGEPSMDKIITASILYHRTIYIHFLSVFP